jgi:3-oxoacyl-[acyl-carrier protein] reductase
MNQDLFSLTGRTALITGAAKGLGRVLSLGLARQGANVAAIDMDPAVENLAAEIEALGRKAITAICDITKEEAVTELVDRCVREFGHIDILVNNAGINLKAPAIEQSRANIQPVIEVNLIGTFLCCQAVARAMLPRRRGSIVNISSIAGLAALGGGNNFSRGIWPSSGPRRECGSMPSLPAGSRPTVSANTWRPKADFGRACRTRCL